jgi:hypothetical protein
MSEMYVPGDAAAPAAAKLLSNPGLLDSLARDPKGTLGEIGLTIDDVTASAIQAQARTPLRSSTYQAAIIHIDT